MDVKYLEELAGKYWWMLAGSAVVVLAAAVAVPFVITKLPADYFSTDRKASPLKNFPFPFNYVILFLKNLIGVVLVLYGIILLFVPGQGILTILAGLTLMNFPGKRKLIRKVVSKRVILEGINWIRRKAGKKEMEV